VRNVTLAEVDALPVPVLPIATVYPPDYLLRWHERRRAQFLYAVTGTMLARPATEHGRPQGSGPRLSLLTRGTR
jgi:hypothetical protein